MSIEKRLFGFYGKKEVFAYTLKNKFGASVTILTYGGIINQLLVPDKNGKLADIVCGFDSIGDYISDNASYSGAIIGRYGNRIFGGEFFLNGKRISLSNNEEAKACHLHGGNVGFNRRLWEAETVSYENKDSLILTLFSPDGEEGYPGNLFITVTYSFDNDNALDIHYHATTDKDTVLNMTNHAYFNLNGYNGSSVLEQEMFLNADFYDEVTKEPTSVQNTEFDFRNMRKISREFDHSFIINGEIGQMRLAAKVLDKTSGRNLTLYTDLPAVQLYTAGGMNGKTAFKGNVPQKPLHALCLETQFCPNTPNRPYMPQCTVTPEKAYDFNAKFVFGTE